MVMKSCVLTVRDKVSIVLLFEQWYLFRDGLMFHHHIVFRAHLSPTLQCFLMVKKRQKSG